MTNKEGHLSKDCPNDKKKDDSPLNSTEEINKKFDAIMKRKEPETETEERDDSEKKTGAGTAMFVGGEVFPSYEEILAGEDDDDYDYKSYAF